mmetsp:Transcript_721/g.2232  ORF Transcript_721/g.2232 Transcript_721/m.2232 type:complete len:246 (+) Transcript_721:1934-2671(+)
MAKTPTSEASRLSKIAVAGRRQSFDSSLDSRVASIIRNRPIPFELGNTLTMTRNAADTCRCRTSAAASVARASSYANSSCTANQCSTVSYVAVAFTMGASPTLSRVHVCKPRTDHAKTRSTNAFEAALCVLVDEPPPRLPRFPPSRLDLDIGSSSSASASLIHVGAFGCGSGTNPSSAERRLRIADGVAKLVDGAREPPPRASRARSSYARITPPTSTSTISFAAHTSSFASLASRAPASRVRGA